MRYAQTGDGGGESNNGGGNGNGGTTGNPDHASNMVLCYGDRIVLRLHAPRRVLGMQRAKGQTPRPTPKSIDIQERDINCQRTVRRRSSMCTTVN